jgi:hypothetical protein
MIMRAIGRYCSRVTEWGVIMSEQKISRKRVRFHLGAADLSWVLSCGRSVLFCVPENPKQELNWFTVGPLVMLAGKPNALKTR